jgi:hypothetical protein
MAANQQRREDDGIVDAIAIYRLYGSIESARPHWTTLSPLECHAAVVWAVAHGWTMSAAVNRLHCTTREAQSWLAEGMPDAGIRAGLSYPRARLGETA